MIAVRIRTNRVRLERHSPGMNTTSGSNQTRLPKYQRNSVSQSNGQRPARRQPPLQSPAKCRSQQTCTQPHAKPRMPQEQLPYGHRQRLRRRKPRGISWLLKDIDTFKKTPKPVRWIGQMTMRECVSLKKITKLVVDGGRRDGPDRKKRGTDHQNQHAQPNPTQSLVASQSGKRPDKSLPQIPPAGRGSFSDHPKNSN